MPLPVLGWSLVVKKVELSRAPTKEAASCEPSNLVLERTGFKDRRRQVSWEGDV